MPRAKRDGGIDQGQAARPHLRPGSLVNLMTQGDSNMWMREHRGAKSQVTQEGGRKYGPSRGRKERDPGHRWPHALPEYAVGLVGHRDTQPSSDEPAEQEASSLMMSGPSPRGRTARTSGIHHQEGDRMSEKGGLVPHRQGSGPRAKARARTKRVGGGGSPTRRLTPLGTPGMRRKARRPSRYLMRKRTTKMTTIGDLGTTPGGTRRTMTRNVARELLLRPTTRTLAPPLGDAELLRVPQMGPRQSQTLVERPWPNGGAYLESPIT